MSPVSQRKITVVGAGYVGMSTAQKCAEKNLAAEIVLTDVLEGRAEVARRDLLDPQLEQQVRHVRAPGA